MQAERFAIAGPLLLTPAVYGDARGHFQESWNRRRFADLLGVALEEAPLFDQDNQSLSSCGVLRGLHYQLPPEPQGKLVRCVAGEIFDVAVDLRRSSASYGQWLGVRLSAENHQQLWVPPGFAHGFLTLSDRALVLYKTSGFWNRDCERAIRWDDPRVGIDWPLADLAAGGPAQPQLSEKDAVAPDLASAEAAGDLFP